MTEKRKSIERIQKAAVKVTLKNKFRNYEDGLIYLKIDDLNERRKKQSLKFAKNCVKNAQSTLNMMKVLYTITNIKLILQKLRGTEILQFQIYKDY